MIDQGSPIPLHEQLAGIIRERITAGELAGRIPSILTLAQEYEVSHNTAARALAQLRDAGVIVSARGRGYYVNPDRP